MARKAGGAPATAQSTRCRTLFGLFVLAGAGIMTEVNPAVGQGRARDGAGVRVVTNAEPLWPADKSWRVDAKPRLVLGDPDATWGQFDQVRGVVQQQSGNIVVANMGSGQLRFFTASGVYLRDIGRR